jgi:hypothetical protein
MRPSTFLFLFFLCGYFNSYCQTKETKQLIVKYTEDPISIDGVLDEEIWSLAKPADNFWQYFPSDTAHSKQQTEIRMLFSKTHLYVGIKVNAEGKDYVIPSLRRDFRAGGSDNVTLMFDTFNDGSNAFLFGTNPLGVRREALVSGGGIDLRGFNTAWDTKWIGETIIHDTHYISEWAIPLSAFKYREGETKWRFNSYQFDTQTNERNTWVHIPQNQLIFGLAYMGDMIFERPLGKSKSPISIIPFVNAITEHDFATDQSNTNFKTGGDAKFTIGSMNLDLTLNPDFSQVEVDQQVTNLTRFEVGLPERRQFFTENRDLFADFGSSRDANPFFSRRIGIAKDIDDNTIENDIIAGARLSGKLNNDLRLGFLNMQTAEDEANEIATTNNMVMVLQQKLFSRSNLGVFFINKQATKDYAFLNDEDDELDNNSYNRVLGIDYNLASSDNTFNGRYYFHKSFSPNTPSKDFSTGASTQYNGRNYGLRLSGLYIGEDYRSELGFVRRTDIVKMDPKIERLFWPKKGPINKHSIGVTPIFIWRPSLDFKNSDYTIFTRWEAEFKNQSQLNATMTSRYTFLFDDFDPTGSENGIALPIDTDYHYTGYEVEYRSDMRKKFSFQSEVSYGAFYNGNKFSIQADLRLRLQPYFFTSMQINYDGIQLPDPYPDANIWLIGPRFDVTFNKSVFWSTFIQYSNQSDNFGINSRLQWRFAPLSDLFIVYNDNYFTNIFAPRYRSINAKLTYWLNI